MTFILKQLYFNQLILRNYIKMKTETLTNKEVLSSFNEVLNSLSEKEKCVIERRIWLTWIKETLQSIWDSFSPSITRERVRQIEDAWIKKVWRIIKATSLSKIQDKSKEIINLHWGILTRDNLINAIIKELNISKDINSYVLEIIIQSDYDLLKSKPKLWTQTYFYLPKISKNKIEKVYKEALKILKRKKDVMEKMVLYKTIAMTLSKDLWKLDNTFIDSVLDIFDDIVKWEEILIWLTRWKILNPKTLKDKTIYVMKKEKIPMHFVDIANKISSYLWDSVKISTIHNELIRNDEFVLIWRWIYALKEWGFKPWTVLDVIVSILEKNKEPMNTEDIIKKVLEFRNVKRTTIYMNLQNKEIIERVWRNYYQLKK